MKDLRRALVAEGLKLRRTLALRLAILVPVAVLSLQALISIQKPANPRFGENPLVSLGQNAFTLWALLALPLYGALTAALVAAVDHQGSHWKQLLAQPIRIRPVFLAKWVAAFALLIVSFLVMWLGVVGLEEALRWIRPAWRAAPRPLVLLSTAAIEGYCASMLFVSIQTWISLRSRSFITGPAVAVVAVLVMLGGAVRFGGGTRFIRIYPWALPMTAVARLAEPNSARLMVALVGVLGGLLVMWIGSGALERREWF